MPLNTTPDPVSHQSNVPRQPGWLVTVSLVLAGVLQSLCYAPDPLPAWLLGPVQIATMAWLVVCVWRAQTMRQVFWNGWVFGWSGFVVGLYWLTISMHQYGGMPLPLAIVALTLLSAYLAGFSGLAALLARFAADNRHSPLVLALAWASAWTLSEWLRSTLFTGFPWMAIGYAQADTWLAAWASVFGVFGVHFIAAYLAATLAVFAIPQQQGTSRLQRPMTLLIAIGLCLTGLGISRIDWSAPTGNPLRVRIVQGNIEQGAKFHSSQIIPSIRHHLQLAQSAPTPSTVSPQLILLPETVIPVFQYQLDPSVWDAWKQVASNTNSVIMLGAPIHDRNNNAYTNSVIRLDGSSDPIPTGSPQPGKRYDKHHLVPFGEFIPWGFRWFVNMMAIPLGDFDRGGRQQQPFEVAGQRVAPNICYEDVFGEELLPALKKGADGQPGATILANFSNLGWFGDTWALRQHWQMARVRAIETARPMLRATNTGLSGAIGIHGEPLAQLPTARPGVLDITLQGREGLTPYTRVGNTPILMLCVLMLLLCRIRRRPHG